MIESESHLGIRRIGSVKGERPGRVIDARFSAMGSLPVIGIDEADSEASPSIVRVPRQGRSVDSQRHIA